MSKAYYTYQIQLSNEDQVQIQKTDPQRHSFGKPSGALRYKEKSEKITPLLERMKDGEINDSSQTRLLGELLFDVLFDDRLRVDFFEFYNKAVVQEDQLLRVELEIDERRMPGMAALPWEFLCLPESENWGTLWIGTAPNVVFTRRRSQWFPAQTIQLGQNEKLRIALVVSAPQGLSHVEYKSVQDELEKLASKKFNRIELLPIVESANHHRVDTVLSKEPHIFHFIGHGRLENESNREIGQITFVDPTCGEEMWVDADHFSELLNRHRPRVVILQVCEGAKLSKSEAFVGLASRILQQNIPVVVAMQYEVSNAIACEFACIFYQKLAEGHPVDIAAQEGRLKIGHSTQYRKRDFATPVIFMRVADGYLFDRPGSKSGVQTDDEGKGQLFPKAKAPPQSKTDSIFDFETAPSNLNNYKSQIKKFVGREQELKDLTDETLNKIGQSLEQNCKTAATFLHGMEGVGKTELALQYAEKYKNDYPGGICILKLSNEDDKNVGEEIIDFANVYLKSEWYDELKKKTDTRNRVQYFWNQWIKEVSGKVLVIVDNLKNYDDIRQYLNLPISNENFEVLVTIIIKPEGKAAKALKYLNVKELELELAVEMLESIVGQESVTTQRETAKGICQYFGCLPLALELVGNLILSDKVTLEQFYIDLNKDLYEDDLNRITIALNLSWGQLEADSKFLGHLFSLFDPKEIPSTLIDKIIEKLQEDDNKAQRWKRRGLNPLLELGLIKEYGKEYRKGEKIYYLHESIRQFLEGKLNDLQKDDSTKHQKISPQQIKRRFCEVMIAEARDIPLNPVKEDLEAVKLSIPHIKRAARHMQECLSHGGSVDHEESVDIYISLGRFYQGKCFYSEAANSYKESEKIAEQQREENPLLLIKAKNALAYVYFLYKDYDGAKDLYDDAIKIADQLEKSGKTEDDVNSRDADLNKAQSQDGLGTLYLRCYHHDFLPSGCVREKLLTDAEGLISSASETRYRLLGDQDLNTALSENHLGFLYRLQKKWNEALPHYEKALDIIDKLYAKDNPHHPKFAEMYNNLATCYNAPANAANTELSSMKSRMTNQEQEEKKKELESLRLEAIKLYKNADTYFSKALRICKKKLGKEHLEFANTAYNLASNSKFLAFLTENKAKKRRLFCRAEMLLKNALTTRRTILQDHIDVVETLCELIKLYLDMRCLEKTKPLYEEMLRILDSNEKHESKKKKYIEDLEYLSDGRLKERMNEVPCQ